MSQNGNNLLFFLLFNKIRNFVLHKIHNVQDYLLNKLM